MRIRRLLFKKVPSETHCCQFCGEFFHEGFQVVHNFYPILKETVKNVRFIVKKDFFKVLSMGEFLKKNILALSVKVFDEVLEQVYPFLDFNFVHFNLILGNNKNSIKYKKCYHFI